MTGYRDILAALCGGNDLNADDMRAAMAGILGGEWTAAQTGAFLAAMKIKGETPAELAAAAQTMREHAVAVNAPPDAIDMCGTGGDGARVFNVSTAATFVAAAAGAVVAKHGNRAVSGSSGSSDVLAALGVPLDMTPEKVGETISQTGVGFIFAPNHHPAMKHAAGVRRELGVRTMFNLLGPMTNPAGVARQVVGVFAPELVAPYAETLAALGAKRAMVVHGAGLDEITIAGETDYAEVEDGAVVRGTVAPEDAGLRRAQLSEIAAASVDESKKIVLAVLDGDKGAARDITILNAAAGLMVAGVASDFADGAKRAAEAIDNGSAKKKLNDFIAAAKS